MILHLIFTLFFVCSIQVRAAQWQTDPATGKQYIKLNDERREKDRTTVKRLCAAVGGKLPEPRSPRENQFVANLTNSRIYLGMTDAVEEDHWKWDSDQTNVSWFNWTTGRTGGRAESCVTIAKYAQSVLNSWSETQCTNVVGNVVCEKDLKVEEAIQKKAFAQCRQQLRGCYSERGLLKTIKDLTTPEESLRNELFTPEVYNLCRKKQNISDCLDLKTCENETMYNGLSAFYKAYNNRLCNIRAIHWNSWFASRAQSIHNNQSLATSWSSLVHGCKMVFRADVAATCQDLIDERNCILYGATVCGSQPYQGYMETLTRLAYSVSKDNLKRHLRCTY